MSAQEKKCIDKVAASMAGRMSDLKLLYRPYDVEHEEIKTYLHGLGYECKIFDQDSNAEKMFELRCEYALSFDYVAPDTFTDQDEGYFRYQISWGGPSEEIRYYVDSEFNILYAEFWYLDWFDGAPLRLTGDELVTAEAVLQDFNDCGTLQHLIDQVEE